MVNEEYLKGLARGLFGFGIVLGVIAHVDNILLAKYVSFILLGGMGAYGWS